MRLLIGLLLIVVPAYGISILIDLTTDMTVPYFIPFVISVGGIVGSFPQFRHHKVS